MALQGYFFGGKNCHTDVFTIYENSVITTQQAMRYNRQISLAGFDFDKQERLLTSRVLMIGVGGLGCSAAQFLVASGIGLMTLVDDDVVETTNLQRQILHSEASIGQRKVSSASDRLKALNAEVQLNLLAKRQSEQQLMSLAEQHDIVLDCSDNLLTRNSLNRVCYASKTPLVSGAAIRMEGQVYCVVPQQQSACYACVSDLFSEQQLSCVEAGVMSPVVGVIGAMQALEAIKILTDYGHVPINQLQLYDAMTSQWQSFKVVPRSGCSICEKTTPD